MQGKNKTARKVYASEARKKHLDQLHALIDKHLKHREFMFEHWVFLRDTTMHWDLIAAAVEDANIEFHKLTGKDAMKMKGRSKVAFQRKRTKPFKPIQTSPRTKTSPTK